MELKSIERRRGRRVSLEAPVLIRVVGAQGQGSFKQEIIKNISLAGCYFETDEADAFRVDEAVITSVSVPAAERKNFPFTRLAGRSRVIRVTPLPPGDDGRKRSGVAIEFSDEMTALTATPSRG